MKSYLLTLFLCIIAWGAVAQPRVAWWRPLRFARVPMEDTLTVRVPCVVADADNVIWTGRGKWLCGWDEVKKKWDYHRFSDSIASIDLDKNGLFWVVSERGKIIQYNRKDKTRVSYPIKNLPSGTIVHKIWIDKQNIKWVCTSSGLYKATINPNTTNARIESMPDLAGVDVRGICQHGNLLKVATNEGLYQYAGAGWDPVLRYDKKEIWGVDVNIGGDFFMAYKNKRPDYVLKNDTQIVADSTRRYQFSDVLADDYGRVWGTTLGGVQGWSDAFGGWHYFTGATEGLPISKSLDIIQDNKGNIWVGAEEGLYRLIEPKPKEEVVNTNPVPNNNTPIPLNPLTIPADTNKYVAGLSQIHLVLVLDISGSMETSINRMALAFHNILKYLRPDDKVSIIAYASKVDVKTINLTMDKQAKIKIEEIFSEFKYKGGTNIRAALAKAGQLSRKYKISGGNNRIIIVSDANFDVRSRMADVASIATDGIKVSIFCSQKKTPDQHKDLEEFARRGRGVYFNFATANGRAIEQAFWSELGF